MRRLKTITLAAITIILSSVYSLAESTGPDRETIDATVDKIEEYWSTDNMQSWAGLFSEEAIFVNSWLSEPVVGKASITQMASQWPKLENVQEWRVIEGDRMVVGWRERAYSKSGKWGGWYRGMSTFVFDQNGHIKAYEGVFNVCLLYTSDAADDSVLV